MVCCDNAHKTQNVLSSRGKSKMRHKTLFFSANDLFYYNMEFITILLLLQTPDVIAET